MEENSNDSIRKFFKYVHKITTETGCSPVYAHHFSKGDKEDTRAIDRVSGGGTFGRACTNSISINKPRGQSHCVFEFDTRNFPPMPNIICEREGNIWKRRHDLESQAKEVRKDGPNEITPEKVVAFLSEGAPVHFDVIFNLAKKAGYKAGDARAFKANLDLGVQQGLFHRVVIRDGGTQPKEGYTKTKPREHIEQEVYKLIPPEGVSLEAGRAGETQRCDLERKTPPSGAAKGYWPMQRPASCIRPRITRRLSTRSAKDQGLWVSPPAP